jgi:signal transduction histidine kinase
VDVALERERSGQEYRELLGDLSDECAALGTLINQLLLLAESDSGQLPVADAPVGLHHLAERSVEMFRGVAEQRELSLEVEALELVEVRASATHLRQVIHNLLDNAIKFTPAGGRVSVAVRREGTGRAVLVISDTGRGIPPEHFPHVFERFFRGDAARARGDAASGSGLGLCICQSIIRACQGEIAIESAPGEGTTVRVSLPACSAVAH